MSDLQRQIEAKILAALSAQRAKFNATLASKDAEIASLKSQLAAASARFKALAATMPLSTPARELKTTPTGLARMAAGIKLPSKG